MRRTPARPSTRIALAAVAVLAGVGLVSGATSPLMVGALGATGAGLVGRGAYQLRQHTRAGH